jgi:hypothetical protein
LPLVFEVADQDIITLVPDRVTVAELSWAGTVAAIIDDIEELAPAP